MRIQSPFRILLATIVMLGFPAGSAVALDFSTLPRVFFENFQGETSSPTTPEVDLLGTGGLLVDGALTGSAAHLDIDPGSDSVDTASYQVLAPQSMPTAGSDHGFRMEFEELLLASEGTASLAGAGLFEPIGAGVSVQITFGVTVTKSAGGDSAELRIAESDSINPGNITSLALSSSEASMILAGAAVRLDALVEAASATVTAEVEIDGISVATTTLNLVMFDEYALRAGVFVLAEEPVGPVMAEVDLTRLETYAQPYSFEGLYNIDVGRAFGVPTSSFSAAGSPGHWNGFDVFGVLGLLDTDGNPTGASATLTGETLLQFGPGTQPDLSALFGDFADDCSDPDQWSLDFTGLDDGVYRLFFYAPEVMSRHSGDIAIDGSPAIANLPGVSPAALIQGTSWESALAVVSGGTVSIHGTGTGSASCVGVAAVQVEIARPVPIRMARLPALVPVSLLALVGILGLGGIRRLRADRHV